MRKYFREIGTLKKFVKYKTISNGVILTIFDEETGNPICNEEYQRFVSNSGLESGFQVFDFKMSTSKEIETQVVKTLPEILHQLENYGIMEESARSLKELSGSYPHSFFHDLVNKENLEFEDFTKATGGDDDYYFSEAEELFPFIRNALVPILKKMLIEYSRKTPNE